MAKKKSRSDIEDEVKVHVAAEKKSHFYVEHLAMVDYVTEDELHEIFNSIMVHHYLDATEERSISKLCGYPVCGNELPKAKKQQYHIALKQQKVYDMSQRKFFCSDFCFKASKFIENQIPTEPIWLRSKGTKTKFLHRDDSEEIRVNADGEFEDLPEPEEKIQSTKETFDRFDKFEAEEQKVISPKKGILPSKGLSPNSIKLITNTTKTMENKDLEILASLEKIKTFLNEWIEGYTIKEETIKTSKSKNTEQKETHQQQQPDEKEFKAKVMNFFSRNADWTNEASFSEDFQEKMKLKNNSQETSFMPPIDWKSQVQYRKKIVKEKVMSSLDKLQEVLELTKSDFIQLEFFSFLKKLKYTRENIVLKTKEWTIITICLLHIYSQECSEIAQTLDKNTTHLKRFLTDKCLPDLTTIKNICTPIPTTKTTTDNNIDIREDIDSDDGSVSDDEAYWDNIFPPDSTEATATNYECDLSTICEYANELEELD